MPATHTSSEGPISERSGESNAPEAQLRQLRRRYDSLRQDYEHLLDRVGDLEEHEVLAARAKPQRGTAEARSGEPGRVAEGLVSPLLGLRDEYLAAVSGIQTIVESLDRLAAQAFRGGVATLTPAPAQAPAPPRREAPPDMPEAAPRRISLDVSGRGFGELLDFQERVSGLTGVARVSISAIESDRASLVVELEPEQR